MDLQIEFRIKQIQNEYVYAFMHVTHVHIQ